MKKKTALPRIPENCCLACCFAVAIEKSSLSCVAQPPRQIEVNGSYQYVRGVPVLATDPPCTFFKPKEHA